MENGENGCSHVWATTVFATLVGTPAIPPTPRPKFKNSTLVDLNWNKNFQVIFDWIFFINMIITLSLPNHPLVVVLYSTSGFATTHVVASVRHPIATNLPNTLKIHTG